MSFRDELEIQLAKLVWYRTDDNWLSEAGGRDLLIGGRGSDFLLGGTEDDLLIVGVTLFDSNLQALDSVMAE